MKTFKEYENIDKENVSLSMIRVRAFMTEYQGKKVKLNDPIRGGSKKVLCICEE